MRSSKESESTEYKSFQAECPCFFGVRYRNGNPKYLS